MSNNDNILATDADRISKLRSEGLMLHMKGAGYAFAFCTVVLLIILVFMWIGQMLPEESRETEDPTPFSHVLPSDGTQKLA